MKEAAGEANLTVVAIILIAVVVAVATPLISSLMKGSASKACCTDAGGVWKGGKCVDAGNGNFNSTEYGQCRIDAGVAESTKKSSNSSN